MHASVNKITAVRCYLAPFAYWSLKDRPVGYSVNYEAELQLVPLKALLDDGLSLLIIGEICPFDSTFRIVYLENEIQHEGRIG